MLLMVFAIIMSIINLKLYYVCTSLHMAKCEMFKLEIQILTNLEELSFLSVLALPKASSTGLDCSSCSLTLSISRPLPDTAATYCMMTLLASVK